MKIKHDAIVASITICFMLGLVVLAIGCKVVEKNHFAIVDKSVNTSEESSLELRCDTP